MRLRGLATAAVLVSMLAPAMAEVARGDGPRLVQSWDQMSPQERDEARRNYERYRNLPPNQQRAVERNYDRWQQLPPQEKDRLRGNYQRYREMSPEQRQDFQRRYHDWKQGK